MSSPTPLQREFVRMVRDKSRDRLDPSECWDLVDYIPNILGAPLTKRGGWSYHGVTLNSLNASAGQPHTVLYAPFSAGTQVVAIDSSVPRLFDLSNAADRGSVNLPVGPLVYYRNMVIIPSNTAGANPQKYTGSGAPAALGGTPPDFIYATVYKDRLVVVQQSTTAINEIKRLLLIDDGALGGTFTVTVNGQTTAGIAYNASPATIQAAIEALSNVAVGDVTVTDNGTAAPETIDVLIEFKLALGGQDVSISSNGAGLTGSSTLSTSTTQNGSGAGGSTRLYFSGAGNAESWDTTLRFMDTSADVVALAALRSALLVFHSGSVERIRGDIPPGSAAANMTLEPLFDGIGAQGSNAVAVFDGSAYFADDGGVYQTDGATLTNLTQIGGIETYYQSQYLSTQKVAVGVWRGYVFVSMLGTSDAYVDFLVYEIRTRSWFRLSNVMAYNFSTQHGAVDELYFSNRDTSSKQLGKLSTIFSPSVGVKNDADGSAVLPSWETGLFDLDSFHLKRWGDIYLSHDIRDAASDNPVLTVSYLTDPAGTSYTALSPTLSETTGRKRSRIPLSKESYGVALKVAQTGASSATRLYGLEADVKPIEGDRLAS